MNCACGDPSCGYCQAARSQYMNTLYNFDDFIPVDPCNAPLTTILEENEDDYVRDENQNGDEDDEEDDDDYYVEDESSEIVMPQQTGISLNRLNDLQKTKEMSDYCSNDASPFGDYDLPSDEPSPKYQKLNKNIFSPLSPTFELKFQSKLRVSGNSTSSTTSDDSDDESLHRSNQLKHLETLFKESILRTSFSRPGVSNTSCDEKLDLVSEDEKKRLRNTEAARRCREKIKRKTDDLETELTRLTARNEVMNQHRIRLLSQVEEQMRMLENIKSRNPELEAEIRYEAKKIVDTYTHQVETKRKAIQDYFDMTCNKLY